MAVAGRVTRPSSKVRRSRSRWSVQRGQLGEPPLVPVQLGPLLGGQVLRAGHPQPAAALQLRLLVGRQAVLQFPPGLGQPVVEVLHHVEPVDRHPDRVAEHLPGRLGVGVPQVPRDLVQVGEQAAPVRRQPRDDRRLVPARQHVDDPLVRVVDQHAAELAVPFFDGQLVDAQRADRLRGRRRCRRSRPAPQPLQVAVVPPLGRLLRHAQEPGRRRHVAVRRVLGQPAQEPLRGVRPLGQRRVPEREVPPARPALELPQPDHQPRPPPAQRQVDHLAIPAGVPVGRRRPAARAQGRHRPGRHDRQPPHVGRPVRLGPNHLERVQVQQVRERPQRRRIHWPALLGPDPPVMGSIPQPVVAGNTPPVTMAESR